MIAAVYLVLWITTGSTSAPAMQSVPQADMATCMANRAMLEKGDRFGALCIATSTTGSK